jgi:photosystem II stability/assembly factor-like uncharacterized protein
VVDSTIKERLKQALPIILITTVIVAINLLWRSEPSGSEDIKGDSGKVISEVGKYWVQVGRLGADLQAVSFTSDGKNGATVSLDGVVTCTRDGGREWKTYFRAPLADGEIATAVIANSSGGVVVGAGVDESKHTAFYESDEHGQWRVTSGEYGGIAGGSSDGTVLVGGGGLIAIRSGSGWKIKKIAQSKEITLYGAARDGKRITVVGDYGFVAESNDGGENWAAEVVGSSPLYSVVITGNKRVIAGGAHGKLWAKSGNSWGEIKGLDGGITIYALLSYGGEIIAAGSTSKDDPIILSSVDGKRWKIENSGPVSGRITGLAAAESGVFAVTSDSQLIRRVA